MSKITPLNDIGFSNITTASLATSQNNDRIEAAFANTLSRDGSSPNQMEADLDMNSKRMLNLPAPASDFEPVRLIDFAASGDADALALELASTMTGKGASKIGVEDSGGHFSGTIVEAVLAEIAVAHDAHLADATNAHAASAIGNTPAGTIVATTVQAAINELDSEKSSTSHVHTENIIVAASDETTALTTGTSKVTFRMPYAFTLSAVRASLSTAQTSGSIFTVDINDSGTTVLSTKITIDNTEKTSTTAATAAVISDTSLADDAEITIDIDQVGDGTATGLKVTLIGTKT